MSIALPRQGAAIESLPPVWSRRGLATSCQAALIRSLRYVEPVTSFRSTFAYTNITHMLAGRIVAGLNGATDWSAVAQKEILDRLGMTDTTFTAEAVTAAANHAQGHRWTPSRTIEVPFESIFPYGFGAAGAINSTIEDMALWVRLQLGDGSFEGERIVSSANLAVTRTPWSRSTRRFPMRRAGSCNGRRTAA